MAQTSSPNHEALPNADPRVLVLQLGARLHYAVPAVYARGGALYRFYTDACASIGVLSAARRHIPSRFRNTGLRRLLGRTLPPQVAPELVRADTLSALVEWAARRFTPTHGAFSTTHQRLQKRILGDGFGDANCLYALDGADLTLMKVARDAGLALLYEQIICPSVGRIMREERGLFPGIEVQESEEIVESGIARDIEIFRLVDVVICASNFTQTDVLALAGTAHAKVTPYGVSDDWLTVPRSPVPGRILCVGTVGLRKGHHYLAEATRILKSRGVACDVRVVGPYDRTAIARPEFRGPTYLGQIPRESVRSEFARADVFALPTIADGFAIAHLEALACGVPVVTTPNCGSQVRDAQEGFIVPIRDARALADRLEQLTSDRALRERMSQAARRRAADLNWGRFGDLLLAATRDAMSHRSRVGRSSQASAILA